MQSPHTSRLRYSIQRVDAEPVEPSQEQIIHAGLRDAEGLRRGGLRPLPRRNFLLERERQAGLLTAPTTTVLSGEVRVATPAGLPK